MNATMSPAAASRPRLRERERWRSGQLTARSSAARAASRSSVPSVDGPLTTIASKSPYDCPRRASSVAASVSARLYVLMTTETDTRGGSDHRWASRLPQGVPPELRLSVLHDSPAHQLLPERV